ncbi:MAG: carbohydrate kinase [Pirellulaceae bacterium]
MTLSITAIGEVLWDVFPDGSRFGGAPANVAGHAASLGAEATMVSCVGDDALGRQAISELDQRQVRTDYVRVSPDYPTGVVNVELDESGRPRFTIEEPAAWDDLEWSEALLQLARRCDAVCFGTLGQRSEPARQVIQHFVSAAPVSAVRVCDVNLRPPFVDPNVIRESLERANVLKLSDEEVDIVGNAAGCSGTESEILAELLDNWGLHLIAVTRGSGGATLLSNSERSDCGGIPTEVVDTVGAGDAFTATMICGVLHGVALSTINWHACRIASYVCSQSGATPPIPEQLVARLWSEGGEI